MKPKEIYNELSKSIIGQHEFKKDLALAGFNHYKRFQYANYTVRPPKLNILIVGPSGSGKTLGVTKLCEIIGPFPYLHVDASTLAPDGNSDSANTWASIFKRYIKRYENTNMADYIGYGILYIDEIDKLFKPTFVGDNSYYHGSILSEFLTLFEGNGTITLNTHGDTFSTKNLLIILSGCFDFVRKAKEETDKHSKAIGFSADVNRNKNHHKVTRDDLLEHSTMSKELVGRIHVITETNTLNREELRQIILEGSEAIWPQFERLMKAGQKKLPVDKLNKILDNVEKNKLGARSIYSEIFDAYRDQLFDDKEERTLKEQIRDELRNKLK